MFEFFKNKKNRFLGVDFGTSFLKIIELSVKNQKIYLENYGVIDLNWMTSGEIGSVQTYEEKMVICLRTLMEKTGIDVGGVNIAIPGFSGFTTLIEFPEMKEDEIAKAIQFEAHKYIPASMDEMAISWEIIKKNPTKILALGSENRQKKMEVLLVAAPKREISKYEKFVTGSGLEVKSIELETFSIARCLTAEEMGSFLIIDIGARATNILFIEGGTIRMSRSISSGGNEITATIADGLNISKQRAETLKKGDKDLINSSEGIVIPTLELIAGESLRILNVYKEKNREFHIDKIILSGGTSNMKGLEEYFTKMLGIQSIIGDPWKNVEYDLKLKKAISKLGSSFTVAIGLAMRGIDEYKRG
jgi:type IV pilus assembly protein PilM